jgi:hypothetical protein
MKSILRYKFNAEAPSGMVQLARTGSFFRADQGQFKVTKAMLLQMRDNAIERGVDIPLKLTHEKEEYAAGWISPETISVQPWRNGYGLFGKANFTDETKAAIRQGAVRYISPEIVWNAKRMSASRKGAAGENIGPMLVAAALVLSPFFEMEPVVAYALKAQELRQYMAAKGSNQMHYSWMNLLGEEKLAALGAKLVAAGVKEAAAAGLAAEITLMMLREQVKEAGAEVEEEKPAIEIELKSEEESAMMEALPGAEGLPQMTEEEGAEGMMPSAPASQAPALAASLQRIAAAFGLKTTANTEQLVALASALKDAQNVNSKRLAALEAVEKKRQDAEAQELFARYSSESRFRSYSTAADPKGESYAKELLSKSGVEVFKTVFEPVAPLKGAAPAAPVSFSANSVSTTGKPFDVSPAKVMEYQAQHNIATYGEALKRILAAQK